MDKRPIGYIQGKGNPLDKKPPANKKYQNVKSKLEGKTGMTSKDVTLMSDQHVAKRKGELFQRLKPSTLANLLAIETNPESIYDLKSEEEKINYMPHHQQQYINDTESVYSFVTAQTNATQISQITQATENLGISDDVSYLILDMREQDDFLKFHISEALNFPAPNISRDKFIPELFRFKNKENKMIVIYHVDERNGTPQAQLLSQKGYENIFLLTGGIESFMQEYPELIEGNQIPNIPKLNPGDKKKKLVKRSNHKQFPQQEINFKQKDGKGDQIAQNIITNNQSSNLSSANHSDISSVSAIKNPSLNNKNIQLLSQQGAKK